MKNQNGKTVDELSQEIEVQRLEFKLETERVVLDSVKESLQKIVNDTEGSECPDNKSSEPAEASSSNKDKKDGLKDIFKLKPMPWVLGCYAIVIAAVLAVMLIMSWKQRHICNNVCIVLVTILIITTVVLILSGRYCLLIKQLYMEARKNEDKDADKESKKEPSFKDKVIKRTQEAVLEIVVQDTIDSFKKSR
ncbi:MAG: hypothetical protein IKY16_04095 [Bacteroidales bacterium]|nr:hypothetical protein [Bacteroidales bacterium]